MCHQWRCDESCRKVPAFSPHCCYGLQERVLPPLCAADRKLPSLLYGSLHWWVTGHYGDVLHCRSESRSHHSVSYRFPGQEDTLSECGKHLHRTHDYFLQNKTAHSRNGERSAPLSPTILSRLNQSCAASLAEIEASEYSGEPRCRHPPWRKQNIVAEKLGWLCVIVIV